MGAPGQKRRRATFSKLAISASAVLDPAGFYEKTGAHEPAANMKLRLFTWEGQGLDAGGSPFSPPPKLTTIKLRLHEGSKAAELCSSPSYMKSPHPFFF